LADASRALSSAPEATALLLRAAHDVRLSRTREVIRRPVLLAGCGLEHLLFVDLEELLAVTSFIAMREAAIPPDPPRNSRRLMPTFLQTFSVSSWIRCSTCFVSASAGNGMYSPLETIASGPHWKGSSSAGAHRASAHRLKPGIFFARSWRLPETVIGI